MDLHWCGYAIYLQGIQAPRSQFKKRDKFGLTKIIPINTECKNCHQQESKNYTTFCPHAFRAKGDSMCHMYPVEDCVNLGGSRVIDSNYHTRNMTPGYTSLLGTNFRPQPLTNQRNVEISVICYVLCHVMKVSYRALHQGEKMDTER